MLSFARNRRHNGLQLQNAVCFLACGISERMNEYLHYLGLSNSRSTALEALRSLSGHAIENLKEIQSLDASPKFGPFICIDNLDMAEKVHMSSVGHSSMMFHGTWGYIHRPSQDLLATLDSSQLNLETYLNSIKNVGTMSIEPEMLMQTPEEADHYSLVWKSQIAQVLNKYIAVPDNRE